MAIIYHERRTQSIYLSDDPDDAGLRYRISGDLLLVYETARARENNRKLRGKERGEITRFSGSSGSRMGRYLRECTAKYQYMHTLTYPNEYPSDGKLVKYQLKRYLQEISRIAVANGRKSECSHFWFIEFQARGAPHFHILTTEFIDFNVCAQLWYDIVGSNDKKHLKAGIRVEKLLKGKKGMISYARKYAMKSAQKDVPKEYRNVGRFWGINGIRKVVSADTVFFADNVRLNSKISEKKHLLDDIIVSMVKNGTLRLIKGLKGFRMFHIEQSNSWFPVLMAEINSANELNKTEYPPFIDAELEYVPSNGLNGAMNEMKKIGSYGDYWNKTNVNYVDQFPNSIHEVNDYAGLLF